MSTQSKFPMNFSFETVEELEDATDSIMGLTLTNIMCSKYYNEPLPKVGETLFNLFVDNMEGAVQMNYKETIITDVFDDLLESLTQKEDYEMCDVLVKWKQAYDSKFSK